MIVAVNKIMAPEAHRQHIIEHFEREAPRMKQFKGFLGMEIWAGEDNTLQVISRWESKEAIEEYTRNPIFQEQHSNVSRERMNRPETAYYTVKVLQ
ncbi:MAG TPA: antibiotic biosynthesis monooxygenase family protein [Ktedonobacteraceae bacterium]|jgi:heme-degrading monooxygenase HmoA|nr:antibiotic biosynthesis monooxygenase family protein [Ktedonobacteraceae bacterium]